jgi:hypothetical protein
MELTIFYAWQGSTVKDKRPAAQFTASVGTGRGERIRGHAFQLRYEIVSAAGRMVEVA